VTRAKVKEDYRMIKRFLFPLNLQLFSDSVTLPNGETVQIDPAELGGDEDLDGIELEDDDDEGLQIDESDDGASDEDDDAKDEEHEQDKNQEAGDKTEQEQEEVKPKGKEQDATARAVMAERNKWKAKLEEANKGNPLLQKLMQLTGITNMEQLQTRLDAAEAATIAKSQNITPEQAQIQLQQQRQHEQMQQELRNLKYENEAQKLMQDPFFADLSDHRQEFQEIADRTGLTLEEVYMSKRGKVRMKEMEREIEARVTANQSKKQKAKVDTTGDGTKVQSPKVDLSPDLMAAAKMAVNLGHFKSVEEYAQYHKKYGKK
jgi:hypothetical protein